MANPIVSVPTDDVIKIFAIVLSNSYIHYGPALGRVGVRSLVLLGVSWDLGC